MDAVIEFQNIVKSYKSKTVLNGVSLTVRTGELVALIGASGCGKTTLLKTVNRLGPADSGEVLLDGEPVSRLPLARLRRGIGYVVQDGGLFPHLTVEENLDLVLKNVKLPAVARPARVTELLRMVELPPDEYRALYPCQLSGGQRQRVGVARAFAADPGLILMDEPFSALDPLTRAELQDTVVGLQRRTGKTILFVTHDMDEAVKLAQRICFLEDGRVVQYDTPENVLRSPADEYVADFVGKNRLWGNPEFIKARDIMKKNPSRVSRGRSVLQALQVMNHGGVDSVLVTEGKRLEGVVWLSDLQKFKDYRAPLDEFISQDYISVYEDTSLQKIIDTIDYNLSGVLPVISHQGELLGYLTKSILLATLCKQYETPGAQSERSGVI